MSENAFVTKAASVIGSATFFSRVLGYIRDMAMAGLFGAGFYSDAFIAAFRIPNLFRRLFAEGSLSIAFIPIFTEYIKTHGKEEAFKLAMSALRLLSVILVVLAVAGIILSPVLMRFVTFGFSPDKLALTVILTQIMFCYIIFICLVALCMGILNVLGHFAAPALAPVVLNTAMIGAMSIGYFYTDDKSHQVMLLACGVVAGGVLQLLLQIPFLIKKGFYFWQKSAFFHPGLKKIGELMPFAVVGSAVYQINILIGIYFASRLYEGSISYLYYAERLLQFPLGIFAISIATAVLPSISRQASDNNINGIKETFAYTMKLIFFIMLPSMAGLIILRDPIISLLFQRFAFDSEAARMTASALLYGCAGLWAIAAVRIVVYTFYAIQDMKTPVIIAIVSIIANIIFSMALMGSMGHNGLALAASLASILNLFLLVVMLRVRLGALGMRAIVVSACKSLVCSGIMGTIVWRAAVVFISRDASSGGLLAGLLGSIGIGIVLYILTACVVMNREFESVMAIIKKTAVIK